MADELLSYLLTVAHFSVSTFDQILDATGATELYLGAIFICFSFGFLLYAFRNGFHSGLDAGSDKAAKAYMKRSSRPYRLGQDHKIH